MTEGYFDSAVSEQPVASPPLLPIPYLDLRWVHAGAQHLSLLPNPITTPSTTYKAFSATESERIEERWSSLTEEDRVRSIREWAQGEGEGAPKREKKEKDDQKAKAKEKEKENEKEHEHPVDSGAPEVVRSGEEQKDTDLEARYKDLVAKAQKDYEDLELVQGIAVSQVRLYLSCTRQCSKTECRRTLYSR